MSDYTPTTEEVRASHAMEYLPPSYGEAAFNRWLAAHDAEIEREAFTRGFAAGDDARSTAELDALTAAELYVKQREAAIRADEREKAAQRVVDAFFYYYGASKTPSWLIAAARGGEQDA